MKGNRTVKLITLLLITVFMLQLLPADLLNAERSNEHGRIYNVTLSSNGIHNEAVLLPGRLNLEPHQRIQARYFQLSPSNAFTGQIPVNLSYFQSLNADCRQTIRKTIPRHFDGNKYKKGPFVS